MYQGPPQQQPQQPPPQGYPQQGPPMGYQQPMGQPMGRPPGGGNMFVTPGVQMYPLERMAVMIMRIIAWVGLIFVIISACTTGIAILTSIPSVNGFQAIMSSGGQLLGNLALQIWGPALLLGVAAIIESLAALRNKA